MTGRPTQPPASDREFEALLDFLRQTRGFDFTGYKRSTLMRRVAKRMAEVSVARGSDYMDYLQVHPDEFQRLFDTILINVTSFRRDAEAWDYLERDIVPSILERLPAQPIRIWSAGCASGEEAYSLAISFAEALGLEEFQARVKIYATDVDEQALAKARHGFTAKDPEPLPAAHRDKYFEDGGGRYASARTCAAR